jgi:hypothetical protein
MHTCLPGKCFFQSLSNSLKYRSTARSPVVTIKYLVENNKVVMQFSDNGLGIDLNKHAQNFLGYIKRSTPMLKQKA